MLGTAWKKGSRSGPSGHCVEARVAGSDAVEVRNSKRPDDGTLTFTNAEWKAFTESAKLDEFDLA